MSIFVRFGVLTPQSVAVADFFYRFLFQIFPQKCKSPGTRMSHCATLCVNKCLKYIIFTFYDPVTTADFGRPLRAQQSTVIQVLPVRFDYWEMGNSFKSFYLELTNAPF